MTSFVVAVLALVLIAGAALLWPALRSGADPLRTRRKALQDAFDAGVLSKAEFDAKCTALAAEAPATAVADNGRAGSKRVLIALAVALPLAAIALYFAIGRPDALSTSGKPSAAAMSPATDGMPAVDGGQKPGMDMEAAIDSLRAKLDKNPGDADGWLLLGRAYQSVGRNDEGGKAFQKAYELAPDRPAIEIAYAESIALTSPTRRIDGKPLQMIHHAMKSDPENQDGLWLLGMSDYQNGRYAEAIASWEKIRKQLGPDSDVLESVNNMIGDAQAHLRGEPVAGAAAGAAVAAASSGPRMQVRVALAKKREGQAAPGDTVFVFAKAAGGPPTPLAIRRLQASDLPTTIELTDADAMVPEMRLSKFRRVTVTARISKSGDASPKPGDLQSAAIEADTGQSGPIDISIDQVVP